MEWNRLRRECENKYEQLRRKKQQVEQQIKEILAVYPPQVPFGQAVMSFTNCSDQIPVPHLPYTCHTHAMSRSAIGITPTAPPPPPQFVVAPGAQSAIGITPTVAPPQFVVAPGGQ